MGRKPPHHQNRLAQHVRHKQIDVGGEDAIDGKLVVENRQPLLAAGEIKIGKLDRLLDLEGAVADKKHMGRMGFDLFHGLAGKPPGLTLQI